MWPPGIRKWQLSTSLNKSRIFFKTFVFPFKNIGGKDSLFKFLHCICNSKARWYHNWSQFEFFKTILEVFCLDQSTFSISCLGFTQTPLWNGFDPLMGSGWASVLKTHSFKDIRLSSLNRRYKYWNKRIGSQSTFNISQNFTQLPLVFLPQRSSVEHHL